MFIEIWQPETACKFCSSDKQNRSSVTDIYNYYIRIDGLVNGVIKVADFGLAEDMYDTNYYRRSKSEGEERVPIRWMAPESIETNIYNQSTDVVSLHALVRQ